MTQTRSAALARTGARRPSGFTLIEVLAAVLLTSIVLTVAVSIFINISNATATATARMRETRHAISILDRIAHDLESAFLLVKPADMDPLEHPWFFFGESEYSDGSDRLKFVIRSHQRRSSVGHSSDMAVVSYALVEDEFGTFDLLRSLDSSLPERLDLEIPLDEEDGAMLLAEGIESFSVRFMSEDGGWRETWDSSQMLDSGTLPLAAEIQIAFADPNSPRDQLELVFQDDEDVREPIRYKRRVTLPMRPVPLEQIVDEYVEGTLNADEDGDDSDPDKPGDSKKFEEGRCSMTFYDCAVRNRSKITQAKGAEGYEACLLNIPGWCIEDWPGRKICGVRVECIP